MKYRELGRTGWKISTISFGAWAIGASIWDVGCYPINHARLIVGAEPLEVFGWQEASPDGIDESFVG